MSSPLDLNTTFGALLLGTVISAVLYGVTCAQVWHYFLNYSDHLLIKILIVFLFVLETLHSAFNIHAIYYYTILNYINPSALIKATWSASSVVVVSSFIQSTVHLFYTWRIYIVSRKFIPLVVFLVFLDMVRLGAGLSVAIESFELKFFSKFETLHKIMIPEFTVLSLGTFIDIVIAITLSVYLQRSKTGISGTNKMINRLMVHALHNGVITSIADMLCLIMGVTQNRNLIYLSVYQTIGNLYTNSMLATLNARGYIADVPGRSVELSGMKSSFGHAVLGDINKSSEETYANTCSKGVGVAIHKTEFTV